MLRQCEMAYHESGHAVLAEVLAPGSVLGLRRKPCAEGGAGLVPDCCLIKALSSEDKAMISVAGFVAVAIAEKRDDVRGVVLRKVLSEVLPGEIPKNPTDCQCIHIFFAESKSGQHFECWARRIIDRSQAKLFGKWEAVSSVGEAFLCANDKLSREDFLAAFRSSCQAT